MPDDAPILDQKGLRRFMTHTESLGYRIRQSPVFDDQNGAANQTVHTFGKVDELVIGLRTDRTLRAMLENKNGIGFRFLQKVFEIAVLR